MLFTSPEFFILLLGTMLFYYRINSLVGQKLIVIVSSFVFYAWHAPKLLALLCFSIGVNVATVYFLQRNKYSKKAVAILGVVINLLILAFFKYSPLLGKTFFPMGSGVADFLLAIPLPIGISFFTFQGLSLVIDVYRDEHAEIKLPKKTLALAESISMYIAFFPQLIAGPVVKAHEFLPQIGQKYFRDIDWEYCFKKLVIGYFLKMVIADNLKDHTFWMQYPYFLELSGANALAMLVGYSMQIFADFAGYSSIALGLAGLFGYRLHENFMFPYISQSFSEFWRRWHISLSTFLKEYLYISLGGNRKGKLRTYINLMLTMVLGGFWHGAAWSYAVWGAAHGLALASERWIHDLTSYRVPKAFRAFKMLFVFAVVTLLWLLFRLPEFSQVILYVHHLFEAEFFRGLEDMNSLFFIAVYSLPILCYHLIYLQKQSGRWSFKVETWAYALMLCMIVVNSGSSGSFIYFQF
ncbi:MBOAT family protein [Marinilongibacter aquaticus]|uniref:MBOAT family O-acyltransferase n=1 Tax=Marinilongibacter aquaticus TaxID=2975157 RepID=UPI0021BDB2F9|nr:MBOAT family O-acyltransferase [Marinilongibacter aquaticus]UBM58312.1 MBOAT family protein [Marinilongibacter aquaticus]